LSKRSKPGSITTPDLKLYYRVIATRTIRLWHKNMCRSIKEHRRPRISPHSYCHLILDEGTKNTYMKITVLLTNCARKVKHAPVED
jgi:hypothetical protein